MDHPLHVVHLEHDGKVLLVDSEGHGPQNAVPGRCNVTTCLRFPSPAEIQAMGIPWQEKRRVSMDQLEEGSKVSMGYPNIPWPENWAWKDDLISDDAVHPVARESVYRSIHRVVSKVIVVDEEGRILMGKVARGHFVGAWTLPGGYLDHDEHPQDGCVREAMEEFGIRIALSGASPTVTQRVFDHRGLSFLSFTYTSEAVGEVALRVEPAEIAEAAWFSPSEAAAKAVSYFDQTAIQHHIERGSEAQQ